MVKTRSLPLSPDLLAEMERVIELRPDLKLPSTKSAVEQAIRDWIHVHEPRMARLDFATGLEVAAFHDEKRRAPREQP